MIYINEAFSKVLPEDKCEWLKANPEKILLIEREEIDRIENGPKNKEYYELYNYKAIALKYCGELALIFEENGYKLDQTLMKIAIKSAPCVARYCDRKYLTKTNIHNILRADIKNYVYIPNDMFDDKLVAYVQRQIRRQVSNNPKLYKDLPSELLNGEHSAFTAINTYTNGGRSINSLKVSPKIWQTNGGKLMFKIARSNLDIALKMLETTERESLAIELLRQDVKAYERFPESLKQNKNVRIKLYALLKEANNMELVTKYFGDENIFDLDKRYWTNQKISNSLKGKTKTETVKTPRVKKGQQSLFTDKELKELER